MTNSARLSWSTSSRYRGNLLGRALPEVREEGAPPIPKRSSIGDYASGELRELYNWVASDGQLRTHDEIADEMFAAFPFSRRGSRIEGVLRDTIRRCEQTVRRSFIIPFRVTDPVCDVYA
jgi:hypothetical protein